MSSGLPAKLSTKASGVPLAERGRTATASPMRSSRGATTSRRGPLAVNKTPVAASRYAVDGLVLGGQVKPGSKPYQRYQCSPSDEFSGFLSCNEEHTTLVGGQYPDQKV